MAKDGAVEPLPVPKKKVQITGWQPANMAEAMEYAKFLSRSALVPKALRGKPEDCFLVGMAGRDYGLSFTQSFATINVIEGRPAMAASLIIGLVKRHEECEYMMLVEADDKSATWETRRRGAPKAESFTFTIADAARMGWAARDNWKKQPKTMLIWRAGTHLARMVYSDLVLNIYDIDELKDSGATVPGDPSEVSWEAPQTTTKAIAAPAPTLTSHSRDTERHGPPCSKGFDHEGPCGDKAPVKRKRGRPRKQRPAPEPTPAPEAPEAPELDDGLESSDLDGGLNADIPPDEEDLMKESERLEGMDDEEKVAYFKEQNYRAPWDDGRYNAWSNEDREAFWVARFAAAESVAELAGWADHFRAREPVNNALLRGPNSRPREVYNARKAELQA